MRRTNEQITQEQSKLTDNYVIQYSCALWGSRKAGYNIFKGGEFIDRVSYKELEEKYLNKNNIEWKDTKKSK